MKLQPGDRVVWEGFEVVILEANEDHSQYLIEVPYLGQQTVGEHELEAH